MRKIIKLLSVIMVLFLTLSASICAFADDDEFGYDDYDSQAYFYDEEYDAESDEYYYVGYTIDAYDVNIVVNENNTLDVTENITANFLKPKHGIYRYIPIVNNVVRMDGSEATVHAKISNVSSNMPIYDKYKDGKNYVIQLGEEDVELTGLENYEIKYTYNIGKDNIEGADEFYYNFIGTGWDTKISNVTFSIQMPKEFDKSKIGFSTGEYGMEGTDIVDFKVDGNVISGKLTESLESGEGCTIRLELEDNYFTFNWLSFYGRYIAMLGLSIIALLVVLILWAKFGRDKKILDIVEFYPPENMNCAEVAFWYKGAIVQTDAVPLLIELANEGYLSIEDVETKGIFKKNNSFRLIKRKSYDGDDRLKRIFFDGIFKHGDEVEEEQLENSFYVTVNEIVKTITANSRTKVFNKKSLGIRLAGWAISVFAVACNFLIFSATSYGTSLDFKMLLAGVAIGVVAFIFAFFIRQRTDEGHEIKQKINGFKMFIETAEKERLEALVEENPSYFYSVLPFAYVLGVSDVWTKKFESIAIQPPQWYYSRNTVWDYIMFNQFFNSTMRSANKTFISTPQSSGSGGGVSGGGGSFGGGGGFSGGGFGGGGGGSW